MEPDWTASYYEALEPFSREPQHVGSRRRAGAESGATEEAGRHLRRVEATLNQLLRQFFLLAPSSLRNELFSGLFTSRFSRPFVLWDDDLESERAIEGATRPDLLFVSAAEVIAVEMKVAAGCSLREILEYALLDLAVELHVGDPRRHYLVLLGRGDFAGQWHEHFGSVTELRLALAREDLDAFLGTHPAHFREHEQRFRAIVAGLDIAFVNYAELAAFLGEARPSDADRTPGAEVYRKLIDGMLAELRRRRLIS